MLINQWPFSVMNSPMPITSHFLMQNVLENVPVLKKVLGKNISCLKNCRLTELLKMNLIIKTTAID